MKGMALSRSGSNRLIATRTVRLSDPVGRGASNGQEEAGCAYVRTYEAPGRSLGGGVPRGRLELPTARFSVVSSTN